MSGIFNDELDDNTIEAIEEILEFKNEKDRFVDYSRHLKFMEIINEEGP